MSLLTNGHRAPVPELGTPPVTSAKDKQKVSVRGYDYHWTVKVRYYGTLQLEFRQMSPMQTKIDFGSRQMAHIWRISAVLIPYMGSHTTGFPFV
jgi:hypothetical protein